jgi:hypothetical protein
MFINGLDRKEYEDARLARMNPEAYAAKQQAMREYNPIRDFIHILKKIFAKKIR